MLDYVVLKVLEIRSVQVQTLMPGLLAQVAGSYYGNSTHLRIDHPQIRSQFHGRLGISMILAQLEIKLFQRTDVTRPN